MNLYFICRGTIKDDRIDSTATSINSTTASNVQYTKDTWYDKLASDDDDKIKKSDNGNPVTNERELVPERVELQANDSIKPQYVCLCTVYVCCVRISFHQ